MYLYNEFNLFGSITNVQIFKQNKELYFVIAFKEAKITTAILNQVNMTLQTVVLHNFEIKEISKYNKFRPAFDGKNDFPYEKYLTKRLLISLYRVFNI